MTIKINRELGGGNGTISNRCAKCNNKYLSEKFSVNEQSIFPEYLDAIYFVRVGHVSEITN
jgi:hypothetical protein